MNVPKKPDLDHSVVVADRCIFLNKDSYQNRYYADAVVAIRKASKRKAAKNLLKYISTNNTSNLAMSDIEEVLRELKNKGKTENLEKV